MANPVVQLTAWFGEQHLEWTYHMGDLQSGVRVCNAGLRVQGSAVHPRDGHRIDAIILGIGWLFQNGWLVIV